MENAVLFSIGHSTLPIGRFIHNLQTHGIRVLVDVRSIPKSRWNPQYNQRALVATLEQAGITYIWKGDALGGKLENTGFEEGISWLAGLSQQATTAMMCSEGDYRKCHRFLVLQPALEPYGISIIHIRTDGMLA